MAILAVLIEISQQLMLLCYIDAYTAILYTKPNPVVCCMTAIVFIDISDISNFRNIRVFINVYQRSIFSGQYFCVTYRFNG